MSASGPSGPLVLSVDFQDFFFRFWVGRSKKKKRKKNSKNVVIFRAFFSFFFNISSKTVKLVGKL